MVLLQVQQTQEVWLQVTYYNSTDNRLKIYDGSALSPVSGGGGTVELTASGNIGNGQPVVINSDGTVGIVTGAAQTEKSSEQTFESGETPQRNHL